MAFAHRAFDGPPFRRRTSRGRGLALLDLQGAASEDACMIAWCDGQSPRHPAILRTQMANGPVAVVDAFGNRLEVSPIDGFHVIALDELPLFVEHINRELVQFRGGFAVEPAFISAMAAVHEHQIVLRNPW